MAYKPTNDHEATLAEYRKILQERLKIYTSLKTDLVELQGQYENIKNNLRKLWGVSPDIMYTDMNYKEAVAMFNSPENTEYRNTFVKLNWPMRQTMGGKIVRKGWTTLYDDEQILPVVNSNKPIKREKIGQWVQGRFNNNSKTAAYFKDCGQIIGEYNNYVLIRLIPKQFIAIGLQLLKEGVFNYPKLLVNKSLISNHGDIETIQKDVRSKIKHEQLVESSIRAMPKPIGSDTSTVEINLAIAKKI